MCKNVMNKKIPSKEFSMCNLCLQNKKLVNSHILPQFFYKKIKQNHNENHLLLIQKNNYKKRSQIGIYEKIVCENCEKIFNKWDNYAKKIFLDSSFEKEIIKKNDLDQGYVIKEINYELLKLFFISLLWRASVSKKFKHVNIGQFEKQAKEMIINNNPGNESDFSVIVMQFDPKNKKELSKNIIFEPAKCRIENINAYEFYLGSGYKIMIKVDSRNNFENNGLNVLRLKSNKLLLISYIPFKKEINYIIDIFENIKK